MQLKMQIKKPPSDKRDEGIFSVVPPKLIQNMYPLDVFNADLG